MADIYAIRNVDDPTKNFISEYAHERNMNVGEALREIVQLVKIHLSENKSKKKYRSFFEIYDAVKFNGGDPNLSKNIDKVLYGKRD